MTSTGNAVQANYDLAFDLYPYARVADQDACVRHPVVVVGGGPVGLTLALDLGRRGTPVVVLDDHAGPGQGSKAICFAKRTLDIAHRLGAAAPMMDKGIVWSRGRVFHGDGQLFQFDLQPEPGDRHPAFINLQQPYFEQAMVKAIRREQAAGAPIEIRGGNRVTGLEVRDDHARLEVDTPDGPYSLEADYLIACDGARSPLRKMMGLGFDGRVFEDNFLIADVRMSADFPTERWFWFQPPFKDSGQSALLHKQPDDVWRIDFQLGSDIVREVELQDDRVRARVDAMLSSQTGEVPAYDLVWTSIYRFQCRRMRQFRHGPVFFAGDSAHQVSPFGARGANSGVQDAENLAWKLDLVVKGKAGQPLLDSYHTERAFAADENILNSSRSTDFMTPKTDASRLFRDAVLDLAGRYAFARPLVNSGRLSVPCVYEAHHGFGPDDFDGPVKTRPGSACCDGPLGNGFLLDALTDGFTVLTLGQANLSVPGLAHLHIERPTAEVAARFLGDAPGAVYLIRPDHHILARWAETTPDAVLAAVARATGQEGFHAPEA
ncbi:FAD-dependent oxidoreductase [Jannaschia pagri]|uniref:FAD-dependent oxidoreductase n=1 Tax=Jannaschia pagri TaxID=2829797 RepID=A0ABQ4NP83_9RHOB|nr:MULTISPECIES: FAD-dependent oxidoreductase [unclassified Jannaschia]GIT92348.1 FAD-dependent oxidoreductase [Jannaschia sp. AI_61]GIT96183.1 FAD-dependent oxidoreductase [Jannaschia sp. AI_62]